MGLAVAAFYWTPDTFWSSTPHELFAAIEGHKEMNSSDGDS